MLRMLNVAGLIALAKLDEPGSIAAAAGRSTRRHPLFPLPVHPGRQRLPAAESGPCRSSENAAEMARPGPCQRFVPLVIRRVQETESRRGTFDQKSEPGRPLESAEVRRVNISLLLGMHKTGSSEKLKLPH